MRLTRTVALATPLLLAGIAIAPAPARAQTVLSFTQTAGVNIILGNPFTFDFGGGVTATATAYRLDAGQLITPTPSQNVTLVTQGSTAAVPLTPGPAFNATGLGIRCLFASTACPTLDADNAIGSAYAVVLDFGTTTVGSFLFAGLQAGEGVQLYSSPTFESSFGLYNLVGAGTGPNILGTEIRSVAVTTPQRFYLATATTGDILITAAVVPGVIIPEPSTGVLAATALAGLGALRLLARRHRRSGAA